MTLPKPTIAILGAGAVGQLIAYQLHVAGNEVGFIAKTLAPSRQQALSVIPLPPAAAARINATPSVATEVIPPAMQHYSAPIIEAKADALKAVKLVIVCVKAYQVLEALEPLLAQLPTDCHIMLLHNGMGPHLAVAPLLGGRGLSLGTTSQGVLRLGPWQIKQTGQGLTQLGHYQGPALTQELRHRLLTAIPHCEWAADIIPCLWQKLAVNAVINPLTAIYQCPNGTLAQPKFSEQIDHILDELIAVGAHDGIHLDKALLQERVYRVIELTSSNYSSMHQDLAHGRRSEIAQINGYICERANAHGLCAPTHAALCERVIQLSRST
ncbi:MAG: ketopantoate reductase family protein [Shewanella sp.]